MIEDPGHKENGKKPPTSQPPLVPPDGYEKEQPTASQRSRLLVLGLGLLLGVVALVVLFLPAEQAAPPVVQPEPHRPPAQLSTAAQQGTVNEVAQETDRLREQWLRLQAAAEAENVAVWGGDSYAAATAQARDCEQLIRDKQVASAKAACTTAIASLEQLMAAKQSLLSDALDAGFQALGNGEPQTATEQFQTALAIDADHGRATEGLRRATRLPDVLRLLETGRLNEQAGETSAALQAYAEANSLDPAYLPAEQNLNRLQVARSERQFSGAMSRALQALSKGELSQAADALRQAQRHKSHDPALIDLKQQLHRAQLAEQLKSLRQKSASLEENEQWRKALTACEQALAIDSSAAFAIGCRARVSRRIELDDRLQKILSRPERLFAAAPLKEARQVLDYAEQQTPRGALLRSQIEQLSGLIRQAEAEVEVVILSDGLTDVVVYHVGRLGRFESKKLLLRTGNYTATGSRNGYRDVRQTFKVRPGAGNLIFTLRCEEPI